jgi:ADP-heptose:LPS heptosyltransferase
MSAPQNILLIRFKSIGDVLLTLPAVNVARENFPKAKITFLTSAENASLLRGFREVNEVIALDRAALKNPLRAAPEFFRVLRRLRAGKFSLAVDFQGYGETAWLTRLTGAHERWGTVYGRGRDWAYTRGLWRKDDMHPADWNLFLLRESGLKISAVGNEFHLPADAVETARKLFAEKNLEIRKPTLFIQPLTSSSHKNWPLENYLAVARHWRSQGVQLVFGGGPADVATLEPARQEKFPVVAGTPLLVTGGLMQLSALVLGGDTGMMHLAVAQGKRALMLLHRLHPGSPLPFQHPNWILSPPDSGSITGIPVTAVIAACERAFSESAGSVSC